MIKIGLLGAGHLGKIHLRLLQEIPEFEVVGFYDIDSAVAQKVASTFDIEAFTSMEDLLEAVDAVDIVTPTLAHFDCAKKALRQQKHIFIEKPLTYTLEEAEILLNLLNETPGLVGQVGHVERFNPAFLAVEQMDLNPMFIEGHRLAVYNPRGTDVSVVLDLMIHDLDVILSLVNSPIKDIQASGVAVVSDSPDISNTRIAFENGCIVNLTASRISMKNMRKLRFFQKNTYLSVDFLNKEAEVLRLSEDESEGDREGVMKFEFNTGDQKRFLLIERPEVQANNAIKMELEEFAQAILHQRPIRVSLEDGYYALRTAHQIINRIHEGLATYGDK